jgi:circadian clock protein KaiB
MSAKPSDKRSGQDGSPPLDVLELRLYVAGKSPNSVRALTNLRALCGEWLADDDWQLEVVDVFADPMRAVEDRILVTPTLLKLTPPVVQIVGDLSQRETVLAALDLTRRKG